MYTVYELPRCVVTGLLYMLCVIEQCVDIIHVQMYTYIVCICGSDMYMYTSSILVRRVE